MHSLVFVYGTLRRGECNAALLRDAVFLGRHLTPSRYTMYALDGYPGVVARGRTAVTGEVWRVSGGLLARLDRLEEHPRRYRRRLIPTPWGPAWIYLHRRSPERRRQVPGGDWPGRGFKSTRIHSSG